MRIYSGQGLERIELIDLGLAILNNPNRLKNRWFTICHKRL